MKHRPRLSALLGDYPCTEALKAGRIASDEVALDFADVQPLTDGFKRAVRGLEFEVAELAMTTFLMAFAAGKPCDELKAEIAAKLDEKKVTGYTLEVVDADKAGDQKVVGSCEGGSKKIVYAKAAK